MTGRHASPIITLNVTADSVWARCLSLPESPCNVHTLDQPVGDQVVVLDRLVGQELPRVISHHLAHGDDDATVRTGLDALRIDA